MRCSEVNAPTFLCCKIFFSNKRFSSREVGKSLKSSYQTFGSGASGMETDARPSNRHRSSTNPRQATFPTKIVNFSEKANNLKAGFGFCQSFACMSSADYRINKLTFVITVDWHDGGWQKFHRRAGQSRVGFKHPSQCRNVRRSGARFADSLALIHPVSCPVGVRRECVRRAVTVTPKTNNKSEGCESRCWG